MTGSGIHIEDVEFVGLRSRLDPPAKFSWGSADARNVGLVKVRLSDGSIGWGETSVTFPLWSLEERAATVRMGLGPLSMGRMAGTLDEISQLAQDLLQATNRLRALWAPVAISGAIAAIEMALLDALGVRERTPVWRLLDGRQVPVPLYAVGFTGGPQDAARQAVEAMAGGFRAVKVRLGFGTEQDLATLDAFRSALGPSAQILADVNMGWSAPQALDMLPLIEPFGLGWLEEPVGRLDIEGLRAIKERSTIPIAMGENCYSLPEATMLIDSGVLDVFMPDLARIGGFLEATEATKTVLRLGLEYSPHHYASDIGFCAMATLCTALGPSLPILRDTAPWPLRETVLQEPLTISDGAVVLGEHPGMGPRPDLTTIERNRVI